MKWPSRKIAFPFTAIALLCGGCTKSSTTRPAFPSGPVGIGSNSLPDDAPDTTICDLQHADPVASARVITNLLGLHVNVTQHTLLITGRKSQLNLALEILDALEKDAQPPTIETFTYRLKLAPAQETATTLTGIVTDSFWDPVERLKPPPFTIAADPRSNTLIIATASRYVNPIKGLIARLDVPPIAATQPATRPETP